MFIRYEQSTGGISGVFPKEEWAGHVPEGHAYITYEPSSEFPEEEREEIERRLMTSPADYVVRDAGEGPALYERAKDAG